MTTYGATPRAATADDGPKLLRLWASLFDEDETAAHQPWRTYAREWFDRYVRLANVITVPEHQSRGYATTLVLDVINWAKLIDADRVDLSATPAGQRIYERAGFVMTTAPRMKLVL